MIDTERRGATISTSSAAGCQAASGSSNKRTSPSPLIEARTFLAVNNRPLGGGNSKQKSPKQPQPEVERDEELLSQSEPTKRGDNNDKSTNLAAQLLGENSTGSTVDSPTSKRSRVDAQRLTVILPTTTTTTSQKATLATPTIAIASGDHLGGASTAAQNLFSSLDVDARFDGVPSCTPISADRLFEVNPFFRNVNPSLFVNQQHQQNGLSVDNSKQEPNANSNATQTSPTNTSTLSGAQATSEQQQSTKSNHRMQLPKLNFDSQLKAAMMLSPYLIQLSPEQEAFIRSFPSPQQQMHHPLSGPEFMIDNNNNSNNNNNSSHHQVIANFRPHDLTKQIVVVNQASPQQQQQQQPQHQHLSTQYQYLHHQKTPSHYNIQQQHPAIGLTGDPIGGKQQISEGTQQQYIHQVPTYATNSQPLDPAQVQLMYQGSGCAEQQHQQHQHQQQQQQHQSHLELSRRASAKENRLVAGTIPMPPIAHLNQQSTVAPGFLVAPQTNQSSPTAEYARHQIQLQHQMNLSPSALNALHCESANGQQLGFYDSQFRNFYLAQQQHHQDHHHHLHHQQQQHQQHQQQQQQQQHSHHHQMQQQHHSSVATYQADTLKQQQVGPFYNAHNGQSPIKGNATGMSLPVPAKGLQSLGSAGELSRRSTSASSSNSTRLSTSSAPLSDRISPIPGRVLSISCSNSRESIQVDDVAPPAKTKQPAADDGKSADCQPVPTEAKSASTATAVVSPQVKGKKKKISNDNPKQEARRQVSQDPAAISNQQLDANGVIVVKKKSKGGRKKKLITPDEMVIRKNRSKERNRVAAKRCRQKRKMFLDELRDQIDALKELNLKLEQENSLLKRELESLKQQLSQNN